MARIGLHDADKTKFGNLALMKLSAYYKSKGHMVEWYQPHLEYDRVFSSKVFTYTKDDPDIVSKAVLGGSGYSMMNKLPDVIEHSSPDYELYGHDVSRGFTTRGCVRNCSWCVVPKKEGAIHAHAEVGEFLRHDKLMLMDNNILAHEHGIKQLERIAELRVKLDVNQGIDARLIDLQVANLFSKIRWLKPVRLACDTVGQMHTIEKAVNILRQAGVTPRRYFCYVLVKDIDDALERVEFLRNLKLAPFAQPYRDFENNVEPTVESRRFARWVNHKAIFHSVSWDEYKYNEKKSN